MQRHARWLVLALVNCVATCAGGDAPIWVTSIVRRVPRTVDELAAAHEASRHGCLQVPPWGPLELPKFAAETIYDVAVEQHGKRNTRQLRYEYSRLGLLSFGMQMLPEDRQSLPPLTKRMILARVTGDYISIQLRVHRDALTGNVYLYYKPFAAVGSYAGQRSQPFAALMESSVRNVRGLGLFVPPDTEITAEALRTWVGVNRDTWAVEGEPDGRPDFELLFARLRVAQDDEISLHGFVTSGDRTRLNYLPAYAAPSGSDETSVLSTIFFSEYGAAKLAPAAKQTRSAEVRHRGQYPLEQLDAMVAAEGRAGDALDNLTFVLDAIIDGRLD